MSVRLYQLAFPVRGWLPLVPAHQSALGMKKECFQLAWHSRAGEGLLLLGSVEPWVPNLFRALLFPR